MCFFFLFFFFFFFSFQLRVLLLSTFDCAKLQTTRINKTQFSISPPPPPPKPSPTPLWLSTTRSFRLRDLSQTLERSAVLASPASSFSSLPRSMHGVRQRITHGQNTMMLVLNSNSLGLHSKFCNLQTGRRFLHARCLGEVTQLEIVTRPILSQTRSPVKLIRIFRRCLYVTQLPGCVKNLNRQIDRCYVSHRVINE